MEPIPEATVTFISNRIVAPSSQTETNGLLLFVACLVVATATAVVFTVLSARHHGEEPSVERHIQWHGDRQCVTHEGLQDDLLVVPRPIHPATGDRTVRSLSGIRFVHISCRGARPYSAMFHIYNEDYRPNRSPKPVGSEASIDNDHEAPPAYSERVTPPEVRYHILAGNCAQKNEI